MTLMQLINLVLDEAYAEIPGSEAVKDAEIKTAMAKLAEGYKDLKNPKRQRIDYACPQLRFVYIYKYTVAHADYIRTLILYNKPLEKLFKSNDVTVSCVGGGPGSDLLGILKHMFKTDSKSTLTCYLFDCEGAWGDSWSDVAKKLQADFQLYPVFQQFDVTDPTTWAGYRQYLKSDLFTLSYFMSEVWSFKDSAEPFFTNFFAAAKPGALFLFIDNNDQDGDFANWFDQLAEANSVKLEMSHCCEMTFSLDEEKKDLEPYFSKFDWPKRKSRVAYRIGKKL